MQREGFGKGTELRATTFTIENDAEGDLLPILGALCDAIDWALWEGEDVLVLDIGGGVAALAAYSSSSMMDTSTSCAERSTDGKFITVMKKHEVSLPEAMMVITRARLKREKPTPLPTKRIIETLDNDIYLGQLEMWEACKYDMYENKVLNPSDPREDWIVLKVEGSPREKRDEVQPVWDKQDERFPQISEHPHRLSTIEEVAEEAYRLSGIYEATHEE